MAIRNGRSAVLLVISLILVSCDLNSYHCTDTLGCVEISPNSPLEIGAILATNGHLGPIGTACLESISTVIKEKKSVLDHQIILETYLTDGTPDNAREAAIDLATNPELLAVIGPSLNIEGEMATSILTEAGIVSISPVPDPIKAKELAERVIAAIVNVAIQKADKTLIIPRQALRDALEPSP